jgi:hypothetical protein
MGMQEREPIAVTAPAHGFINAATCSTSDSSRRLIVNLGSQATLLCQV